MSSYGFSGWVQRVVVVRFSTGALLQQQGSFCFLQPAQDGAVDDLVADLHPDATHDCRVEHDVDLHRPAIDGRESPTEALTLCVIEGHGGGNGCGQLLAAPGGHSQIALQDPAEAPTPRGDGCLASEADGLGGRITSQNRPLPMTPSEVR